MSYNPRDYNGPDRSQFSAEPQVGFTGQVRELDDYQEWATTKAGGGFVSQMAGPHSGLLNGIVGLAAEVGELANVAKKVTFHGKEFTEGATEAMLDELGDVLFYVAMTAQALGYTLEQVADGNKLKLDARYPEGFDSRRAPNV